MFLAREASVSRMRSCDVLPLVFEGGRVILVPPCGAARAFSRLAHRSHRFVRRAQLRRL